MHTHTVFFWLIPSTTSGERKQFEEGLRILCSDKNVRDHRVGGPAATNREVVDNTYDYALVLHFESLGAHNAYQTSEAHDRFLNMCRHMWWRVQVYDIDETAVT